MVNAAQAGTHRLDDSTQAHDASRNLVIEDLDSAGQGTVPLFTICIAAVDADDLGAHFTA